MRTLLISPNIKILIFFTILGASVIAQTASPNGSVATESFIQSSSASGAVLRNAQDKLRDTVSILDFTGVDRTGTSDSTTGIQNALNYACQTGQTVWFPPGTYHVSSALNFNCAVNSVQPFSSPGGATLEGAGIGRTILQMTSKGMDLLVANSGSGTVHYPVYVIRDMTLQGPDGSSCVTSGGTGGSGTGGGGLVVKGSSDPFLYVSNVISLGFCAPGSSGFYVDNAEDLQFDHLISSLNDNGVTLANVAGPDNGSVINNVNISQSHSNGWLIAALASVTFNSSTVQSSYGNGINATDMNNVIWNATHLENDNFQSGSVVNTSSTGNAVTWVSGATFGSLSVGQTIWIQGVVRTINRVLSPTSLTLTAPPGNQTSVAMVNPNTGTHGILCTSCINNHFDVLGVFGASSDIYLTGTSNHNRFTGGDRNGFQAGALITLNGANATGNIWEGYQPQSFLRDPRQTECLLNSELAANSSGIVDITCPTGVFQTLYPARLDIGQTTVVDTSVASGPTYVVTWVSGPLFYPAMGENVSISGVVYHASYVSPTRLHLTKSAGTQTRVNLYLATLKSAGGFLDAAGVSPLFQGGTFESQLNLADQLAFANYGKRITWPSGVFISTDGTSHDLVMGAAGKYSIDIDRGSNGVTIGNSAQSNPLSVVDKTGTCEYNNSAGGYSCSSDESLKTKIVPLGAALAQIMNLSPRKYNWKSAPAAAPRPGLIAQEVKGVIPEAVHPLANGTMGISYQDLIPYLVRAIQEQQAEIDALKKGIAAAVPPK